MPCSWNKQFLDDVSGSVDLDLDVYDEFEVQIDGNASFTFTGTPDNGRTVILTVYNDDNVAYTMSFTPILLGTYYTTFPTSVQLGEQRTQIIFVTTGRGPRPISQALFAKP